MPDQQDPRPTAQPTRAKVTRAKATTSSPRPRPLPPEAEPTVDASGPAPVVRRPALLALTPAVDVDPALADITVERGGLGSVHAREVVVSCGGIGAARAETISVELGGIGAAMAREIRLSQGAAQAVVAGNARFEQAFVRSVLAGRVEMGQGAMAGVVIAGRVDGQVRTLLDWRGALALGSALGLVWALFRLRR
jgi:hypothetical protein